MFPDWLLILNAILGLIGIFIGIGVIRKKINIKQGIIIGIIILLIGRVLIIIMTM